MSAGQRRRSVATGEVVSSGPDPQWMNTSSISPPAWREKTVVRCWQGRLSPLMYTLFDIFAASRRPLAAQSSHSQSTLPTITCTISQVHEPLPDPRPAAEAISHTIAFGVNVLDRYVVPVSPTSADTRASRTQKRSCQAVVGAFPYRYEYALTGQPLPFVMEMN